MAVVNTRLGISVNLPDGGKHDLLLIDYADSFPEGLIEFKLNNTPRKISGIQKVAQLFLKILFTTRGSDVINQNLGTQFPDHAINANRTVDTTELFSIISEEVSEAERQCKAILNTVGSDEASMLDKITILALDGDKESIIMYLKLTTVAGVGAQVAIPFPQLDMKLSEG